MRPHARRTAGLSGLLGAGAGVLYANFVLDWVRRGSASLGHLVSELAAPGERHAWLYRSAEVGCAALTLPMLPAVRRGLPPGPAREAVVGGTAVFAVGAAVAGLVPTPHGPRVVRDEIDLRPRNAVHDGASIASDTGLYAGVAAAWLATRRGGPRWLHRAATGVLAVGGASSLVFAWARPSGRRHQVAGVSQRVNVVAISVWLGCLGVLAARTLRARHAAEAAGAERPGPEPPLA